MKMFISALTLCLIVNAATAQDKHVTDSLKQKLRYAKQDTNRVNILIALGNQYAFNYPDTALNYTKQAMPLAENLDFVTGEMDILNVNGFALTQKGDYTESLSGLFKALQLANELGNKAFTQKCLSDIAWTFYKSGNYQKSLDYFFNYKAEKKVVDNLEMDIDEFIAEDFLRLNKLDSAQYFAQKSYHLSLKEKEPWYTLTSLMAELSERKGQFRQALHYIYPFTLDRAHAIAYLESCNHLASIYQKMGMTDSSLYYAKKVIYVKEQTPAISQVLIASKTLKEIYSGMHMIDSAFKYQGMMMAANDSLFSKKKVIRLEDVTNKEIQRRRDLAAAQQEYADRIRTYIFTAALAVLLLIGIILWRNYKQQKSANEKIQKTLAELKSAQTQLIQSEKMASLGELTAGIAHEIQNPLNFVNNFSEVNKELLTELKQELAAKNYEEVGAIADDVIGNEEKINHHGKRADSIVKAMLQHSQAGSGTKEPTSINALADDSIRLAYHRLRAKDKSINAEMVTHLDPDLPKVNAIPQDIGRVLLNLFNNAFYAVYQKQKTAGADCNGINFKDIALLRKTNIDENMIRFIRSKTKKANQSNQKILTFPITDKVAMIISKWEKDSIIPDDYLFDVLDYKDSLEIQQKKIDQFIKNTNKYIKRICTSIGINKNVTTYFTRHSAATVMMKAGYSIELISESLGHSSTKTTRNYLDSFDDEVKIELANKLTNF